MDNFLANKIIEDLIVGTMTTEEAWKNLLEAQDMISDEKYDEIAALITEQLIEAEVVEDTEDLELEDIFGADAGEVSLDFGWDEPCFEENWDDETDFGEQ